MTRTNFLFFGGFHPIFAVAWVHSSPIIENVLHNSIPSELNHKTLIILRPVSASLPKCGTTCVDGVECFLSPPRSRIRWAGSILITFNWCQKCHQKFCRRGSRSISGHVHKYASRMNPPTVSRLQIFSFHIFSACFSIITFQFINFPLSFRSRLQE